ncbi:Segregation and condensation protein B [Candidatus Gugararchaeum adminiculabundum]|nr:Segregation and condensation protein B [Candidatus Gugararchaeum adminiculabundum]
MKSALSLLRKEKAPNGKEKTVEKATKMKSKKPTKATVQKAAKKKSAPRVSPDSDPSLEVVDIQHDLQSAEIPDESALDLQEEEPDLEKTGIRAEEPAPASEVEQIAEQIQEPKQEEKKEIAAIVSSEPVQAILAPEQPAAIIIPKTVGNPDARRVIEASLFTASAHLTIEELAKVVGTRSIPFVQSEIAILQKEYDDRQSAISINQEDGKYIMRVKSNYAPKVKPLTKETEISKGALKVLGFIYKSDGITKNSLVRKLGSTVYQYVAELTENEFIVQKPKGRTKSLHTTQKFKGYFGV